MASARTEGFGEFDPIPPIRSRGRKPKPKAGKLLDPQAMLPGAIKRVNDNQLVSEEFNPDPKHLKERFDWYCKELVQSGGDPVPALAKVFNISFEQATERQTELHAEITRAVKTMSTSDMFDMAGISKPYRVMRLKMLFNSDNPAAILKSIEMLNDMDSGNKSSGESWEQWIHMATYKK